MTSDWGRILKCLTAKSYHALQDDAYSRISLIPQGNPSTESYDTPNNTNLESGSDQENSHNFSGNKLGVRVRPRSVGDISESLHGVNHDLVIGERNTFYNGQHGVDSIVSVTSVVNNNNTRQHQQNQQSSSSGGSGSGGGGFLSFFGVRFNKSATRHLDRSSNTNGQNSSSGNESDKSNGKSFVEDNRYTKFPLSGTNPVTTTATTVPITGTIQNPLPIHPQNTLFDPTHIQLTPQTKTFSHHFHKSPCPTPKSGRNKNSGTTTIPSSNSFLANAVSSLGRKGKDLPRGKQLKVKSKSDNSLHRVTLNSVVKPPPPTCSSSTFYPPSTDSTDRDSNRLNSVQLGDHATIRLPWTGFQQNNLSFVTSNKTHQNTHNNNFDFDFESTRYIDCDLWRQTHHHLPPATSHNHSHHHHSKHFNSGTSHRHPEHRRRSRSLERTTNLRVFPREIILPPLHINHTHTHRIITQRQPSGIIRTSSLERHHHSRLRQALSPSEQEILLRNINRITPTSSSSTPTPPPIPSKGNNLKNINNTNLPHSIFTTGTTGTSNLKFALPDKPQCLKRVSIVDQYLVHNTCQQQNPHTSRKGRAKPPLLGRLHSSAPNSSFSSSDSSCDFVTTNCTTSAPPSPPPRPPSTLKQTSRLINSRKAPPPPPVPRYSRAWSPPGHQQPGMTTNRRPIVSPHLTTDHHNSTIAGSSEVNCNNNTTSGTGMSSLEDARNSGFINKPSKGWLHSDQLLTKEGVTYTVRYIGCLDVNTSMKSLDFDTRSLIAKECINQVCEAAGLKSVDRKHKIDRRVVRILGFRPRLDHAGSDVLLTITSTSLKLTSLETGAVIAVHDMPNISFASGGDATMLDFVAYVAKDSVVGRACFVLECGSGLAQDVITTVGQAFELRFKEYLQKRPAQQRMRATDDPEYYNDLPGKIPPDVSSHGVHVQRRTEEMSRENSNAPRRPPPVGTVRETPTLTLPIPDRETSVNLIDFEAPTPPAFGPTAQDKTLEALLSYRNETPSQDNGIVSPKDPFDLQTLKNSISTEALSPEKQKAELKAEPWFHGVISRGDAEALVRNDGDFLVRESQTTPGQYVLTGLQNGSAKHLLLVDPEGVVRTKDRTFDSVSHLIRHHRDSIRPIISAESMVLLRSAVLKSISSM